VGLLKLFNVTIQGITNYAKLIREMTKVLRPGGMLHLQEWDFFVGVTPIIVREWAEAISQIAAGSEKVRLPDDVRPFARWCSKFREGLQARKASIEAGTTLEAMIHIQNAFGEIHRKDIWMPVGPPFTKGAPAVPCGRARLNLLR
jgi:ubiquinone/menaquinone biosynthesis C-methylase UbiE